MFKLRDTPSESQNPGCPIISRANPVRKSCAVACAPPARVWKTFAYSANTGKRSTILPVVALNLVAETRFAFSNRSFENTWGWHYEGYEVSVVQAYTAVEDMNGWRQRSKHIDSPTAM